MKVLMIALGIAVVPGACVAATLTAVKPGVMCRSAAALGKLTLPDGSSRYGGKNPVAADAKMWLDGGCIDIPDRAQVTVQEAHRNTSVVTYQPDDDIPARTLIVPNVDFVTVAPGIAAPASGCVPDGTMVTLRGELREIHNRDKRSGAPYSYFSVHTREAVCLTGADIDDSNTRPGQDVIVVDNSNPGGTGLRMHLGTATVSGKLEASNGGGPELFDPVFR